jgi:hypothetical protein
MTRRNANIRVVSYVVACGLTIGALTCIVSFMRTGVLSRCRIDVAGVEPDPISVVPG